MQHEIYVSREKTGLGHREAAGLIKKAAAMALDAEGNKQPDQANPGKFIMEGKPCLHRMKKVMRKMYLYEPAEFIMKFLVPRLDFHPIDRHIALHITCSTRQMGVANDLIALAKMCSNNVFLPEGVGCCGFAGDRGFTFPELNKYGLRKLRSQIEANHIEVGYSNSRTCEIGLETNAGIPYMSIVYLVNECTTAKK